MQNSSKTNKEPSLDLALRLPDTAFTRHGVAFQPNTEVWDWVDGPFRVHLDFGKIEGPLAFLREPLKHTLLVFAKGSSASHLSNLFKAFTHFLALRNPAIPLTSITTTEVSNYSARLKDHEKWRLGILNVLLQKWVALGLSGVEPDCARYLREKHKPGNTKGNAVVTRDPVKGPFTEAEYTALYKAVDTAYGTGEVPVWVAVLTRLLFACGARISQYASLKVQDLTVREGSFVLNLPLVKTREAHSRVSFQEYELSPQSGRLAQEYIEDLRAQGYGDDAPLFPDRVVMVQGPREERRATNDLFWGHCISHALSSAFNDALNTIAPPTERLNFEPIPVASKRFRYTYGVRLAEEGVSEAVVARRLTHTDLQNVKSYFHASPRIIENLDKKMGPYLVPLAQTFKGQVVEGEEHSTHKGAPGSRIIDFRVSKAPIGSCSAKGNGCAFNKPVACYTCFKFEPWLDAPHEKVLQRLQAEREKWASDERLAAINDDAIRAVQQVMAECAQVMAQRRQEGT